MKVTLGAGTTGRRPGAKNMAICIPTIPLSVIVLLVVFNKYDACCMPCGVTLPGLHEICVFSGGTTVKIAIVQYNLVFNQHALCIQPL